jgi:hypothetical protein
LNRGDLLFKPGKAVFCFDGIDAEHHQRRRPLRAGNLSSATDCNEPAHFLYASLQGAILESKAGRSSALLKRFKKIVFSTLLR